VVVMYALGAAEANLISTAQLNAVIGVVFLVAFAVTLVWALRKLEQKQKKIDILKEGKE